MFSVNNNHRGVSEVIGFVLLLAVSIAVGVFAVGYAAGDLSVLEERVSQGQTVNTLANVASSQASAAYGNERAYVNTSLSNLEYGDDTTITIYKVNNGSETQLYQEDLGYYKKTVGDRSYYIQSGGIFSERDGVVNVITKPTFSIQGETLTLPLIDLDNAETTDSSFDFELKERSGSTLQTVDANKIKIEVSGTLHRGWGKTIAERSGAPLFSSEEKSTVILGQEGFQFGTVGSGIVGGGDVTVVGGGQVNGDVTSSGNVDGESKINGNVNENTGRDYTEFDSYIDGKVAEARKNYTPLSLSGSKTITAGKYYVDNDISLSNGDDVTIDAADGSVEIVVEGDVTIRNNVNVDIINTSDERRVEFVVDGDNYTVERGNSNVDVVDGNSGHHIVYGNSDLSFEVNQSVYWEGVYYSPSEGQTSDSDTTSNPGNGNPGNGKGGNGKGGNGKGGGNSPTCNQSTASACLGANGTIDGAVIAGNVQVGQSAVLNYDAELRDIDLSPTNYDSFAPPNIVYLNITTSTVVER